MADTKCKAIATRFGFPLHAGNSSLKCVALTDACKALFHPLLCAMDVLHQKCIMLLVERYPNETPLPNRKMLSEILSSELVKDKVYIRNAYNEFGAGTDNQSLLKRVAINALFAVRSKVALIAIANFMAWKKMCARNPNHTFLSPADWRLDFLPLSSDVWNKENVDSAKWTVKKKAKWFPVAATNTYFFNGFAHLYYKPIKRTTQHNPSNNNTHTYIYTHIHTHIHTHIYTHTHTLIYNVE
jgi:hypothetical protein